MNSPVYVTDAHPLIWHLLKLPKLSSSARHAFEQTDRGEAKVVIPAIVVAELILVVEKQRVKANVDDVLRQVQEAENYEVSSLTMEQLLEFRKQTAIAEIHDRLIVVEALCRKAKLITKDESIRKAGIVEVVW